MTENQPSVMSAALKYGVITALVAIVFMLILYVVDIADQPILASLVYIILIAGIVLAIKQYKSSNHGFMSYGQGLGIGSLVSLVVGLLLGIMTWVYTTFVDPGYMDRMLLKQEAALLEKGASQEQIDMMFSIAEKTQNPLIAIFGSALSYLVIGFLLSLIIAAIMKNNRPEFE